MKELSRTEWLNERKKGIGGSDVAAALGLSPWTTPVELYQRKRGECPEQEMTDAMHFGNVLEEVVAHEFQGRTGMKVQRVNTSLKREEWQRANIDRAIVMPEISGTVRVIKDAAPGARQLTTDAILECKTASAYTSALWGESQEDEIKAGKIVTEHEIPMYYETQCQWYLSITGCAVCYVAVLIGGNDFRMYKVDRNEDVIAAITEKCRAFWFDHVVAGVPPEPVNIDDIRALYKRPEPVLLEADEQASIAYGEYRRIKDEIERLKKQQEAVATQLAAFIGDKEGLTLDGKKVVTFKAQKRTTFDSKALKADDPEMWSGYLTESTTRVLRVY